MPDNNNTSVQTFYRLIRERFSDFTTHLNKVMAVFATDSNKQEKKESVTTALKAATMLCDNLSKQDRPVWLSHIIDAMQKYINTDGLPNFATELIRAIALNYIAISEHKWVFDFTNDRGFDFDGVFAKYKNESRISELFDKIVKLLEKILQCEELDSRKAIQTLETLVATIKKNKNGSYFCMMGTWDFVCTYLKKLGWNIFAEIPVVKVLANSLRQTLDEMNKEMESVHTKVQEELQRELSADFPAFTYNALPLPEPLALPDETIIDAEFKPVENPDAKER